jgi:hypothetical protein
MAALDKLPERLIDKGTKRAIELLPLARRPAFEQPRANRGREARQLVLQRQDGLTTVRPDPARQVRVPEAGALAWFGLPLKPGDTLWAGCFLRWNAASRASMQGG